MKMATSFAESLEKHKQKVDQTLPIPRCPGLCVTVVLLAVPCQTHDVIWDRAYSLSQPLPLKDNQVD